MKDGIDKGISFLLRAHEDFTNFSNIFVEFELDWINLDLRSFFAFFLFITISFDIIRRFNGVRACHNCFNTGEGSNILNFKF